MACLAQLAEPENYRPCDWDLKADAAGRAYWVGLFRWHLDEVLLPLIREEYADAPADRLAAFRHDYLARFDSIESHPERYHRLDILMFTELREELLTPHGFDDPFRGIKRRENQTALALLPDVLAELDGTDRSQRQELLTLGLMAGNIFDLGSAATVARHRDGQAAFREARAALPPRPWLHDDVASWWQRWETGPPYQHVLFFVDNAGSDIALGCLPLVREMLGDQTRVTLAANSAPALNDITAAELEPLLASCADRDSRLATALSQGRLRVLASGCRAPLLDLTRLSSELVGATADADLIVLHGMGRAIESNFHAAFRCDTLWTAVLKDLAVAARVGGQLFDCIFRFRPRAG